MMWVFGVEPRQEDARWMLCHVPPSRPIDKCCSKHNVSSVTLDSFQINHLRFESTDLNFALTEPSESISTWSFFIQKLQKKKLNSIPKIQPSSKPTKTSASFEVPLHILPNRSPRMKKSTKELLHLRNHQAITNGH